MRYRSLRVGSLGRWSPQLHTGCHVSGATQAQVAVPQAVSYAALTLYGAAFQAASERHWWQWWRTAALRDQAYNPHDARPAGLARRGFGLRPVRSPLLRACFLFLGVREMFQFPRCPPQPYGCGNHARWLGCPIRRSWDQRLLAAPPRLSQQCHVLHRHAAPRHPPIAPSVFPGDTLGGQQNKLVSLSSRPASTTVSRLVRYLPNAKRRTLNAECFHSSFIV
jgi:hypothetical protein